MVFGADSSPLHAYPNPPLQASTRNQTPPLPHLMIGVNSTKYIGEQTAKPRALAVASRKVDEIWGVANDGIPGNGAL